MDMVWGGTLATFTLVHVVLSLVAIGSGIVVISGLIAGRERNGWTAFFLVTTVATSVTGFGFPVDHVRPSHVVGVVSLAVLAIAIVARYVRRLEGAWGRTIVLALFIVLAVLAAKRFRGASISRL